MEPGCAGTIETLIANVFGALIPQEVPAVTEIFPLVAPIVTVTELVP